MILQDFIDEFRIDLKALERVKKRVFIVGRFNQKPIGEGKEPDVFLFTNRPTQDLSEKYKKNFNDVSDLSYESFVTLLQPALAEKVTKGDKYTRFTTVEQVEPQGLEDTLEGTSVIDDFNYFFQRAIANTDQEAFEKLQPGLPKDMVQDDKKRGSIILTQIRKNLEIFCNFQPDTHEIIDALAILLSEVSADHGLPPFAHGGALPGGLPERLVDFIYAEDDRLGFEVEGLEFSDNWEKLENDENSRQVFCDVVTAFRDALLTKREQFSGIRFRGKPLSKLAQSFIPSDLKHQAQKSRQAFNGLRQILRSKVLLSMVLEWLLNEYYSIPEVKGIQIEHKKDRAVEEAILNKWSENGLAAPVKRPDPDERIRFTKLLTDGFEDVMETIIAPDESYTDLLADLPKMLQELVKDARSDEQKKGLLNALAGTKRDNGMQKAFLGACKTILVDVMCPALYRNPILTTQQLKEYFKKETMEAYLTAVFLSDSDQDAVRKIVDNHFEFFESKIDDDTKKITDENEILQRLLGDFLDVLAAPEMQRRLTEGLRVLQEVHALLDNTSLQTERRGAGDISAIRSEGDDLGALAETPVNKEVVEIAARERARQIFNHKLSQMSQAVAEKTEKSHESALAINKDQNSQTTDKISKQETVAFSQDKTSKTKPSENVDDILSKTNKVEDKENKNNEIVKPVQETRLDRRIDSILTKAIKDSPEDFQSINDAKQKIQIDSIVDDVMSDETFVGGLTEDLAAFERTLHLIYTRYGENPDKRSFRNKVERMTLVNMMLLFQKELGLGRVSSELYQLLLDLVLHLDPDDPDPAAFMREKSLTLYFDDAKLRDGGITALRKTLEVQAQNSLDNTVSFVSELRGIWHLMRSVQADRNAEIVVINATAEEFLKSLCSENLGGKLDHYRLRCGHLTINPESSIKPSDSIIPPGLVYMSDAAFKNVDKSTWLANLAEMSLHDDQFSFLMPPICLSTEAQDKDISWDDEGINWAKSAEKAPAPIFIIGPSPVLNPSDDGFPTILPAGYIAAAHFLAQPIQKVRLENVGRRSEGRFLSIGHGAAPLKDSLTRALLGGNPENRYAFEVDFYLYIVLLIFATAKRQGGVGTVNKKEFFECFYCEELLLDQKAFDSAKIIDQTLIGNNPNLQAFGLDQKLFENELKSVSFNENGQSLLKSRANMRTISNVQWFNRALESAGLN